MRSANIKEEELTRFEMATLIVLMQLLTIQQCPMNNEASISASLDWWTGVASRGCYGYGGPSLMPEALGNGLLSL